MDKYRRQLNKEFADEIYELVRSDAEISCTDSSQDDQTQDGEIIYMHICLG